MYRKAAAAAVLLLIANGVLSGIWSHRWAGWDEATARAAAARVDALPLAVGDWAGERVEADPLTQWEEVIGQGVSIRYTNRVDRKVVTVYLACGPTGGLLSHTPAACYTSNGYTCVPPDIRVAPPGEAGGPGTQFWVSNFSRPQAGIPTYLRVFWSTSDGAGWRCPDNPRRAYRRAPVINKVYALREVTTPDEPVEGDPCLDLLAALLPHLDPAPAGR